MLDGEYTMDKKEGSLLNAIERVKELKNYILNKTYLNAWDPETFEVMIKMYYDEALDILKDEAGLICKECHQDIVSGQMCQTCEKKNIEILKNRECRCPECNKKVKSEDGIVYDMCEEHQGGFDKWKKENGKEGDNA